MMFALWTAVTFRRPFARAYANANSTIRRVPVLETVALGLDPGQELLRLGRPLLVLDAHVQVLGVLANDHEVDVREAGSDSWVGLARPHLGVEVEALAEG